MSPEEFERRLSRTPLRPPLPEWRREILRAAGEARSESPGALDACRRALDCARRALNPATILGAAWALALALHLDIPATSRELNARRARSENAPEAADWMAAARARKAELASWLASEEESDNTTGRNAETRDGELWRRERSFLLKSDRRQFHHAIA
jgi:hypothetical protein